jgi:GntR family transcriptional repressor for pyruvate dehydrogenase complex
MSESQTGLAASFEPVRGQRLSTMIVEQLQSAIFSGAIAEGSRLPPERELMARFEASRASVQEAVHILERTGLVVIRRGAAGGAFVTRPDFVRIGSMLKLMLQANRFALGELYEARLLIEPGGAEIAARLATTDDISNLRASIQFHREIPADMPSPIGRNFHYLLACITANPLISMLVSSLLGVAQAYRLQQPLATRSERLRAHEQITDAIEARDGVLARQVLENHLRRLLQQAQQS